MWLLLFSSEFYYFTFHNLFIPLVDFRLLYYDIKYNKSVVLPQNGEKVNNQQFQKATILRELVSFLKRK